MKKTTLELTKKLSEMAISYTRLNVNSICFTHLYQSRLPDGCQKLKK